MIVVATAAPIGLSGAMVSVRRAARAALRQATCSREACDVFNRIQRLESACLRQAAACCRAPSTGSSAHVWAALASELFGYRMGLMDGLTAITLGARHG